MSVILEVSNVSKTFGPIRVLNQLSMSVREGEVRALLGENGSGKSTFIKILSGYHSVDPGGEIRIAEVVLEPGNPHESQAQGMRFVHQNLGLVDSCSVLDNVLLVNGYPSRIGTVSTRRAQQQVREALMRVGLSVDPRTLVAELPPAWKTGVALARALVPHETGGARVLVLDEPTATLPAEEVDGLLAIVRSVSKSGVAVIYVTHRLEEVFEVADTTTVLRDGREVLAGRVAELDRRDLIHHMIGGDVQRTQRIGGRSPSPGSAVLVVQELVSARIAGVSLQVLPGEIVGIAGLTGSGREQFCGAIFGSEQRDAGEVRVAGELVPPDRPDVAIRCGACYLPADRARHSAFMESTARENLSIAAISSYWRWPLISRRRERAATKDWFERLRVRPAQAYEARFGDFSGGNQQKLVIGRWLQLEPSLFLLDEPTQGIDVGSRAFLHQKLLDIASEGAAVVVSSSDHEELATICDRVLILREGRLTATLTGGEVSVKTISRECLAPTNDGGRS